MKNNKKQNKGTRNIKPKPSMENSLKNQFHFLFHFGDTN